MTTCRSDRHPAPVHDAVRTDPGSRFLSTCASAPDQMSGILADRELPSQRENPRRLHRGIPNYQIAGANSRPLLALARATALALRCGRLRRLGGRFLASLDHRRIARVVPDQMTLNGVLEQRLVQADRQCATAYFWFSAEESPAYYERLERPPRPPAPPSA